MKEETKETTQGTTFSPIFVGENSAEKTKCLYNLRFQFKKAQNFIPLIKEANLPITQEIVLDCLTITKEQVCTYPTDEKGNISELGQPSIVYKHCPSIDAEFAKLMELATEGKPKVIANVFKSEIESTATAFKESVFKVFANLGSYSKDDTSKLQEYVFVDGGEIKLPEDIEERVKQETGVFCKTEEQAQALEAHRQAAEAINAFLAHFPKRCHPQMTAEVGNLFKFGEDGSIQPQIIDYSLYI